eukprot:1158109-Pelagomonas_calceolata.AAC.9
MGDWGGELLDGLITGGQDASLEGRLTICRIRISLVCLLAVFLIGGTHWLLKKVQTKVLYTQNQLVELGHYLKPTWLT